jgi:hypothetical protein
VFAPDSPAKRAKERGYEQYLANQDLAEQIAQANQTESVSDDSQIDEERGRQILTDIYARLWADRDAREREARRLEDARQREARRLEEEARRLEKGPMSGTVTIMARTAKFVPKDAFVVAIEKDAHVKISSIDSDFKEWFLSVEETTPEMTVHYQAIFHTTTIGSAMSTYGGWKRKYRSTTPSQLYAIMEQQPNGETGPLLTNGQNYFEMEDFLGAYREVNVWWYKGGWDIKAYRKLEGAIDEGSEQRGTNEDPFKIFYRTSSEAQQTPGERAGAPERGPGLFDPSEGDGQISGHN